MITIAPPLAFTNTTWAQRPVTLDSGVQQPLDSFQSSYQADTGTYNRQSLEKAFRGRVGEGDKTEAAPGKLASFPTPKDADVRAGYAKDTLIGAHKYAEAASAAYADLDKLDAKDPQREVLKARAMQLNFVADMEKKDGHKVRFPPTFQEVQKHFLGLQKATGKEVNQQFQRYTHAFYDHVQHFDPQADVKYSHQSGAVPGEKGNFGSYAPVDFADVTERRQMSPNGQRLIDCEGYAWLGEKLYGAAGYQQTDGNGYRVVRGKESNGGFEAHVMVQMVRSNGDAAIISNDHVLSNGKEALRDARMALDLDLYHLRGNQGEVYSGRSDREASIHAQEKNRNFKTIM